MTPSALLIKRLNDEFDLNLPSDTEVRRTYAKKPSLATGTWSFFLYSPSTIHVADYGSPHTVTELVASKQIHIYDNRNGHKEIFVGPDK